VQKDEPDILLLLGPFIDINHPDLYTLTKDFATVFNEKIVAQLKVRFPSNSPVSLLTQVARLSC